MIRFPESGSLLCNQGTFFGTGVPGYTLTLCIRSGTATVFCGTTVVASDGTWQVTVPAGLPNGAYIATATQSHFSCVGAETSVSFGIDCACPPPVITSPASGEGVCGPMAFSGSGTPGATLSLCVHDSAGESVGCGAAIVDPNGLWQLIIDGPLPNGSYTAVASQQSDVCTSTEAAIPFLVNCLCIPPVIQFPIEGSVICGSSDFSGSGIPGATVSLCVWNAGNVQVACGTAVVESNGVWQLTLPVTLPNGTYTVVAAQTNGACTSAEASIFFAVNCTCPPPDILSPVIGGSYCQTPVFSGTGTPGAVVSLCVRNALNQVMFCDTAQVDANGNWQLSAPSQLAIGTYSVSASQTSVVCASGETAATFAIDCTCPPPVILSPVNGSTNCGLMLMSGTALPGALVRACIYMETPQGPDEIFCGDTTADGAGNWQVPFPGLDENAVYTVTATQETSSCTVSSASVTYSEECHKCALLGFLDPFLSSPVCSPVTQLTGYGHPDSMVSLFISGPGTSYNTVVPINEFLSWSATIPPLTIPGDYTVTASIITSPCQQSETSGFTIESCV